MFCIGLIFVAKRLNTFVVLAFGILLYLLLVCALYTKYMNTIQFIKPFKKYIFYVMIIDITIAVLLKNHCLSKSTTKNNNVIDNMSNVNAKQNNNVVQPVNDQNIVVSNNTTNVAENNLPNSNVADIKDDETSIDFPVYVATN